MLIALLLACWGEHAYIVEGTVLEVRAESVVVDHEAVAGLMGPMVMPFAIDPSLAENLERGDVIVARLEMNADGGALTKVRTTGRKALPPPKPPAPMGTLPDLQLTAHTGEAIDLGRPTLLTFFYTQCPLPEACPATLAKMTALATELPDMQHVALTLDPKHDTLEVLKTHATEHNWPFLLARSSLEDLAKIGMTDLEHPIRYLVLRTDRTIGVQFLHHGFDADAVREALK